MYLGRQLGTDRHPAWFRHGAYAKFWWILRSTLISSHILGSPVVLLGPELPDPLCAQRPEEGLQLCCITLDPATANPILGFQRAWESCRESHLDDAATHFDMHVVRKAVSSKHGSPSECDFEHNGWMPSCTQAIDAT